MADEETEPKTFDEAYVKKLRDESARYRTQLREYEAPFAEFNEVEREYLFDIVRTLAADPREGAMKVRELAKNILQDEFYDGLDLPSNDDIVDENAEQHQKESQEDTMKPEDIQKMLDEREAKARREAEIEGIFREIEEAGFERGTEGFMTALSLAQTQANLGKDVNFKELAPKVHMVLGTEAPAGEEPAGEEASSTDDPVASATEAATEQATKPSNKVFPKTAETGGTGGAGEAPKDWLAEAAEKGLSPLEAARERAEARLG